MSWAKDREFMMNGMLDPANYVMHGMVAVCRQAGWDVGIRNNVTRIVNHCSSNAAPYGDL
jgi:hypothetical protein